METLRRQVFRLSERVKAMEASLQGSSRSATDSVQVAAFSDMLDEIQEITSTQTDVNPLSWDRSKHFEDLLHWISAMNGSDIKRVAIQKSTEKGYGLYTTVDVFEVDDQPILKIPLQCCITPTVESSFIIGQCISAFSLPDNLKMVGILMSEACNLHNSRWKDYLRSLPVNFHTILHIDLDALKVLQTSLYHDDVLKRFCNMCKHYMNCVAAVDLSKRSKAEKNKFASFFTFELFRWALDVLMTRGNSLPISGRVDPAIALIPLLDMINHREDAAKFGIDEGENSMTGSCELRTTEAIAANSEIFMSYSALSVKERFINHGFITPNEGALQFPIDLHLKLDSETGQAFEKLDNGLVQRGPDNSLLLMAEFSPDGQPSIDTLTILRMAVSIKEKQVLMTTGLSGPLEPALEKFVHLSIIRAATDLLKRSASNIELKQFGCAPDELPSPVLRLCCEQVSLERQRLTKIVAVSSAALKALLNQIVLKAKSS